MAGVALAACGDDETGDDVMGHAGFDFDVPGGAARPSLEKAPCSTYP